MLPFSSRWNKSVYSRFQIPSASRLKRTGEYALGPCALNTTVPSRIGKRVSEWKKLSVQTDYHRHTDDHVSAFGTKKKIIIIQISVSFRAEHYKDYHKIYAKNW